MRDNYKINLALQGGGSHGAFTWGVLDRLLEEGFSFEGISGTSAGAINAALLTTGYIQNGVDGARNNLNNFWNDLSESGDWSSLIKMPLVSVENYKPMDFFTLLPDIFLGNTKNNNLAVYFLKKVIKKYVDVDLIKNNKKIKLFLAATNVRTGQPRIFDNNEFSLDVLLASTCLPTVFPAVKIDEEYYWDGGYSTNPPLWNLISQCKSKKTVIIQINPELRKNIPNTTEDILNRMNEIVFNAPLLSELKMIKIAKEMELKANINSMKPEHFYQDVNINIIHTNQDMMPLDSKTNISKRFLLSLKEIGRLQADNWLSENNYNKQKIQHTTERGDKLNGKFC